MLLPPISHRHCEKDIQLYSSLSVRMESLSSSVPSLRLEESQHRRMRRRIRRTRNSRYRHLPSPACLLLLLVMLSVLGSGPSSSLIPSPFCCAAPAPVAEEDARKRKRRKNLQTTPSLGTGRKRDMDDKAMTLNQILIKAGRRGLGGGLPGAIAGVVQVMTLMWLRTIINYQCRYGTTFRQAFITLFNDGGIPRFYRGLSFALVQAPLSRFVSTAANDGVEALLAALDFTKEWGPGRMTFVASIVVGGWRMLLMPIDTCKTVLQVDSVEGFRQLMRRVKAGKIGVLYTGAIAYAVSAIVGHFPWFSVYNYLSKSETVKALIPRPLVRNALIGTIASFVSDTVVNSIRVIKTTKQAMGARHKVSYVEVINMVLAADGWKGLFGRGLQTRLLSNALQSMIFTVIWRGLTEAWTKSPTERHLEEKDSEEEILEEIYEEVQMN